MHDFELRRFPSYPDDTYLSRVQSINNQDGSSSLYKASRFMVSDEKLVIVDFLKQLKANPHPHLLIPEAFSGTLGQSLVEFYPLIEDPIMGNEEHTIKEGIKAGKLCENDLVDMMVQLTSAVSYIHNLGYVHGDIRTQNIFIKADEDSLYLTLFDYNSLHKPYYQTKGIDSWNMERPPELLSGNVMIDSRFDVYALGYILFSLTHEFNANQPISPLNPNHPIFDVMRKAKAPLTDCYADAIQMHNDLLAIDL